MQSTHEGDTEQPPDRSNDALTKIEVFPPLLKKKKADNNNSQSSVAAKRIVKPESMGSFPSPLYADLIGDLQPVVKKMKDYYKVIDVVSAIAFLAFSIPLLVVDFLLLEIPFGVCIALGVLLFAVLNICNIQMYRRVQMKTMDPIVQGIVDKMQPLAKQVGWELCYQPWVKDPNPLSGSCPCYEPWVKLTGSCLIFTPLPVATTSTPTTTGC